MIESLKDILARSKQVLRPEDICVYCLDELRRGIPENGICGHEKLLERAKALNAERGK